MRCSGVMPASWKPPAPLAKAPISTAGPSLNMLSLGYETRPIAWSVKLCPP
jgi:hypothetical protein